ERLADYRTAGVTRVSLGVQALDDAVLKTLGRLHDGRGARAAFDAAREAGCDDVSVDLMYGLPGLTVDAWAADVERVLDWGPDHALARRHRNRHAARGDLRAAHAAPASGRAPDPRPAHERRRAGGLAGRAHGRRARPGAPDRRVAGGRSPAAGRRPRAADGVGIHRLGRALCRPAVKSGRWMRGN